MVIFGIIFFIMHRIHSVNRRDFENFFGEDIGKMASYFRWDTEKAGRVMKENFGSSLVPTASVTSGLSNEVLLNNSRPKVFEKLSINNKKVDRKFNKDVKNRIGSIRNSIVEKMYPAEHVKLNKKIKKCKREAQLIGGRKGKELFQACKREYNKLLNKTNTEEYVNTYVSNDEITPKVADRYLRTDIVKNKKYFYNNRIKYLEGKDTKQLFRENFNNNKNKNKEHFINKNTKNMIIKRIGKVFRVTMLIVIITIFVYMTWESLMKTKKNIENVRQNINKFINK